MGAHVWGSESTGESGGKAHYLDVVDVLKTWSYLFSKIKLSLPLRLMGVYSVFTMWCESGDFVLLVSLVYRWINILLLLMYRNKTLNSIFFIGITNYSFISFQQNKNVLFIKKYKQILIHTIIIHISNNKRL